MNFLRNINDDLPADFQHVTFPRRILPAPSPSPSLPMPPIGHSCHCYLPSLHLKQRVISRFRFFFLILSSCAITQAVSRRLSTAVGLVRSRLKLCEICCGNGTGAGFPRVFLFPLPILNPQTAPYSLSFLH